MSLTSPLLLTSVALLALCVPVGLVRRSRDGVGHAAGGADLQTPTTTKSLQAIVGGLALGLLAVAGVVSVAEVDRPVDAADAPASSEVEALTGSTPETDTTGEAHAHPSSDGPRPLPDRPDDPRASFGTAVALSNGERIRLGVELDGARAAAMEYPTVRDAKAAGMVSPGLEPGFGAHYQFPTDEAVSSTRLDGTVDPASPGAWIYEGLDDDDPVVGVIYSYLGPEAPTGFTGPNDHWDRLPNACLHISDDAIPLRFGDRTVVTKAECDSVQGTYIERSNWIVHAWVVPGWESPDGVFAEENPELSR